MKTNLVEQPLAQRCLAVFERIGTATNRQVLAEVGDTIPANRAAAIGRSYLARHTRRRERARAMGDKKDYWSYAKPTTETYVRQGRRTMVNVAISHLYVTGRIRRVATGQYAIALKLVTPDSKAG